MFALTITFSAVYSRLKIRFTNPVFRMVPFVLISCTRILDLTSDVVLETKVLVSRRL